MSNSRNYFSTLNYTLANEDTGFEVAMLRKLHPRRVLSVCGSGGRCWPLAGPGLEFLELADLSPSQLHLAELRKAAIERFELADYLRFWGFPPHAPEHATEWRRSAFHELKASLTGEASLYLEGLFGATAWQSPLYDGRWEQTFAKIGGMAAWVVSPARSLIFQFQDVPSQARHYREKFPLWRWKALVRIVGNASFFNALLYKGSFVRKNISESHYEFYYAAYERIFTSTWARGNFFAQLSLFGRIVFPEGVPVEARPEVFDAMRTSLKGGLECKFSCGDILEVAERAAQSGNHYDFVSLSDVPSYFSGEVEKNFLQRLRKALAPGAHVVVRAYMRVPEQVDTSGYLEVTADWAAESRAELTQMYRIQVYRFEG